MKTFEIEVLETLSRVVEVWAKDSEQAIEKVEQQYHGEDIILDADDFVDVDFTDIHADVVTPKADRFEKLIRDFVAENYGDSEADEPSWDIKELALMLAKELA